MRLAGILPAKYKLFDHMKKVFIIPQTQCFTVTCVGQLMDLSDPFGQVDAFPAPERNVAGKLYI